MADIKRIPYQAKRAIRLYVNQYILRRTPVLIYSTGRVGSMALFFSLDKRGVHTILVETLDPERLATGKHPGTWSWAHNHVVKGGNRTKIIFIVRDPIALMITEFFPKLKWMKDSVDAHSELSMVELVDTFNKQYFAEGRHLNKLSWFDREPKRLLGIDVFQYPFGKDTGYGRFQQGNYDCLIIKTELDKQIKEQVVADFVGLRGLEIIRANVGEQKSYGEAYSRFKQEVVVSEENLRQVYSSRYATHFFSEADLRLMVAKWTQQPVT